MSQMESLTFPGESVGADGLGSQDAAYVRVAEVDGDGQEGDDSAAPEGVDDVVNEDAPSVV